MLSEFRTPRSLKIIDWRLGILDKTISACVVLVMVVNLGLNKEGLRKYGTVGFANYHATGSTPVRFPFEGNTGSTKASSASLSTFDQYQTAFYNLEHAAPGSAASTSYTKPLYAFCNDPANEFTYDSELTYGGGGGGGGGY